MIRKMPCLLLLLAPLALRADADWKRLAERFPQAMSVVEEDADAFDVAKDGTYVETTRYRATVLKEPGIQTLARYSDAYREDYDRMRVKVARVIGPDGRSTPVGPDSLQDMPMPAFGPFFLQGIRLLSISFPQLQVGATVELELETTRNAPPMEGAFSTVESFQWWDSPALHQSVRVTLPAAMPLAWKMYRGEAGFTRTEQGERTTYEWQVPEQAQVVAEPSMPPLGEVSPMLAVSTIPDWKRVSRWYDQLSAEGMKLTPALERLVADTIQGKSDREDRIRALFFWVSRNIRYVETTLSGAKAGWKPASAAQTFERRYGVCRDKALFLAALLRHIGVDAHITLINSGIRRDVDIPNTEFNHAIVAIRRDDGGFTFLDPTAEQSRQYLAFEDQDKFALVCTPEGEDLRLTPVAPPADNRMDIALATTLDAAGELTSRVVMTPGGIYDFLLRRALNGMAPARRDMYWKTVVGQFLPGATVTAQSLTNLDDLDTPLRVAFTLSAPRQGIRAGKFLVFTPPGLGGGLDGILTGLLSGATGGPRHYPLKLPATAESRIRERITLPPGYVPRSLPDPLEAKAGGATLASRFLPAAGGLDYQEDFAVSDLYHSGAAYQGLCGLLEQRDRLRDGKVILVLQGGGQ